ncbi:PhnD/SsuA/transferrin family substrate-binding protein [Sphingomonas sp. 2R-10]|uniref:phosphate/phosphite/phosphonate ABC transporter substrate-binding protein n=1 Tax=Sphingomonas sp. 2R-10 TaxID=3045148 RepID=UPI0013DDAF5B|nr:PhnD/SsuA/transferrin family substrate-binding protein [Sphingomonas sp. 2R-10]MDJ0275912.1 PhnD/SsuA/transferrin family substrate-binding protein [Sphingomonas sp. 2R-10]
MDSIAWLGMYDHPGQHAANDALWAGIRDRLRADGLADVPERRSRETDIHRVWAHPGLLLGMICTRPWALLHRHLQLLGHPAYADTDRPGEHRSRIVVRRDDPAARLADLRGRRVAVNDPGSNTGMALLRDRIAPLAADGRFFGSVVETGAHAASARAVAAGEADVAAIDEVTFAALTRFEPDLTGALRLLDRTGPAATPAFVTAADTPPGIVVLLRAALADGIARADPALGLTGIVPPQANLADRIAGQDAAAAAAGYSRLA